MAPESERANECGSQIFYDTADGVRSSTCHKQPHDDLHKYEPDAAPVSTRPAPASCSEVVERLQLECVEPCRVQSPLHPDALDWHYSKLNPEKATAILHSWRERRVQELEELLAKHSLSPEISSTQHDANKGEKMTTEIRNTKGEVMTNLEQQLLSALSKRAPQIAYGDSPEQFVDSVIANVVQPYADRLTSESKLACKLAQYLFDKGDQYHSRLQWDGSEWREVNPDEEKL